MLHSPLRRCCVPIHPRLPNTLAMEQVWSSIWLIIRSWLTPAILFVLVNFMIGTIVLTSKSLLAQRRHDDPDVGDGHVIVRTASSALYHLRSLSLSRLRSGDFFLDPTIATATHKKSDETTNTSPTTEVEVVEKEDEHVFCRSQSETQRQPAEEGESQARMRKSASEPSSHGSFEKKQVVKLDKALEEEVDGGVDARADDFINRFRRQLHLQQLDSLLKYKELLNRGK